MCSRTPTEPVDFYPFLPAVNDPIPLKPTPGNTVGVMPAAMNESERIVYNHLLDEYNESEIKRESAKQSPDFLTPDGGVEVKRLYGDKVIVYTTQVESIEQVDTDIVVVDADGSIDGRFPWADHDEAGYEVKVYDPNPGNKKPRRIDDDLVEEIDNYEGGNFSERLRRWREDSNTSGLDQEDVREVVQEEVPGIVRREIPDIDAELKEAVFDMKEGRI